jgi:transglutaminase-like putative cysteine protease
MKLHILHRTEYQYAAPASYSIQILKLTPRREVTQRTLNWQLDTPKRCVEQTDAFGNVMHVLTLEGPHEGIVIQAAGVVETDARADGSLPPDEFISSLAYLPATPLTAADESMRRWAAAVLTGRTADRETAQRLMEAVTARVDYRTGSSQVSDSAGEIVARGAGVCQDLAHVGIALCRAAGVPARYVSGHILTAEDTVASHAWLDIWSDSAQHWLSCDITHRQFAGANLCRLAVGRDYLDAAPVRGMRRGGGREEMQVKVLVQDAPMLQSAASHANMAQQIQQ